MAAAAEGAGVVFRGFEAIRKIQEQTAHRAGAYHEAAAERFKKAATPNDVLAIQSDLLRFDLEEGTRYWQELGAAAMEMQNEMLGCATHLADTESLLEAASAVAHFESAIPGLRALLAPMPNGWGVASRSA